MRFKIEHKGVCYIRHNTQPKYIKISLRVLIIIATIFITLILTRKKIISYQCNYHFGPRGDLRVAYDIYSNLKSGSISNAADTQGYHKYLKKCMLIGTTYQKPSSDLKLGFDIFEPDVHNEQLDILFDTGEIIFDSDLPDRPPTLFFDVCAFRYNDADLFNRHLIIQNNAAPDGIVLGYLCTVYISPSGKVKSNCIPLDSNSVTVNTKEKNYFLKELCMFSSYTYETYMLQDEVSYQARLNDLKLCDFVIHRVKNDKS